MSDLRPIGVFDSGLGGLTVVKEIKRLLPNENIIYFGDTGRVPYGTRSDDTVRRYAKEDEAFLLTQNVKMIVAACGTVSSVAYMTGDQLPVPFVEVISPAADEAVKATKTGYIGVIGTPVTVRSCSHKKAILKKLPDAVVNSNACPMFVPLVEAGWIEKDDIVLKETAKRYLKPFKESKVDTLIMGCTHYPVLKETIADIMGDKVTLIDPGAATAKKIKELLGATNSLAENNKGTYKYYVSDRVDDFSKIAKTLLLEDITEQVEQIDIYKYIGK